MKNKDNNLRLISIPDIHGYEIIEDGVIIYLKGESNQTAIYTTLKKEPFISSMCLHHYQEILPREIFIRIHKSYIINLKYLKKYIKGKFSHVILKDKTCLNVSIHYREPFLILLGSMR